LGIHSLEENMKRLVPIAIAAVMALGISVAAAPQATKAKTASTTGVVKTVTASSLTVEKGGKDMMFTVDSATKVLARGSTAKTKEKKEKGAGGLAITDVVKAGDQVTVRYKDEAGKMTATEVRVAGKS